MNWRRGLIRLWVALSLVWVAATAAWAAHDWYENIYGWEDVDHPGQIPLPHGWLRKYAAIAFLPSFVIGSLGATAFWVGAGFRRPRT